MKKAISLVLAVALVLALLPSFALASDATAESYVYNFKTGLHTYDNKGTATAASHLFQCIDWISTDSSEGKWAFVAQSLLASAGSTYGGLHSSNTYFAFQPWVPSTDLIPTYSPGIEIDQETQFTATQILEIEVGQAGTYTPSITLVTDATSPKWEIFLTDKALSGTTIGWVNSLDSSDRLGTIDGYGTGSDVTKTFLNRTLEKGTYYLVAVSNGKNPSSQYELIPNETSKYRVRLYWKKFSLKNINDVEVKENIDYDITTNSLKEDVDSSIFEDVSGSGDTVAWKADEMQTFNKNSEHLKADVNQFTFPSDIYTKDSWITDTGVEYSLYTPRYVLWSANGYFYNNGVLKDEPSASAYSSSTNVVVQIKIPEKGKYKLYLYNQGYDAEYGCLSNVYFGEKAVAYETLIKDANNVYKLSNRHDSRVAHTDNGEYLGDVTILADDSYYNLVFSPDGQCFLDTNKKSMSVTDGTAGFQKLHLSGIRLEPIADEPDPELIEAQNNFNTIKATKENAIAVAEDAKADLTAYVNVITACIDSADTEFSSSSKQITATRGQDVTVTADTVEGYDFLYWRSGIGADAKVIASSTECTVKAAPGTWLTAVYKPASSTDVSVLFYNADGEIIDSALVAKDTAITLPSTPTAPAGCGEFLGWALNKKDNIVREATASGKSMVFVAQYEASTAKNIAVTVNGGATGGGDYAYGETVTVTATERENGSGENVFVYWKKGDEIVSFDKTYSFLAWETCTLTPVYAAYKPVTDALRKIIVSGDGTDLMAEFIGIGNVKEKGILFDKNENADVTFANATHKIAMTSDGNFLSAINDIDGGATYVGYAILSDGTVIYDK